MIVRIKPKEIPDFFKKFSGRLHCERYVLAENGHGTRIVLTATMGDEPSVQVFNEGFLVSTCVTSDMDMLVEKVSMLYDTFLGKDWEQTIEEEDPQTAEIDEAYEREDALRMAFYDFLVCVVEDEDLIYDGDYEQDLELIFDDVLQSVADLGLPVRRPMVFDDGDGGCVVLEYPYGCEKD